MNTMWTRFWARAVGAVLGCSMCATSWASYSCTGTLDSVTVSPGTGWVIFSSSAGFGSVYLCLIEGTVNSANGPVSPAQCKAYLALLLSAQASRQQVQFSFNDALTCTTHPSWAQLAGWYYGPLLMGN